MRLCRQTLNHQRIDVDHAVLNQVQREHADPLVFPAAAGHLAAAGEEHEIRGSVPLFDHVQAVADLAAQVLRMQVLATAWHFWSFQIWPNSEPSSYFWDYQALVGKLHRKHWH